jgi:hypothetical protein
MAIASVVAGCGEVDVIVARAGATIDGGALQGCTSNGDCQPELYCAKASCSDTTGKCETRPLVCVDDTLMPVCGCDGVVYWNDCLRQYDGVPATSGQGPCVGDAPATLCSDTQPCEAYGAYCNKLVPGPEEEWMCRPPPTGVCWVLPDTCPADAGAPTEWQACGRRPGPGTCTDFCHAIQSGAPYHVSRGFCL